MTTTYQVLFEFVADDRASPKGSFGTGAVTHPDLDAALGLLVRGQLRSVAVQKICPPPSATGEAGAELAFAGGAL